MAVTTVATGRSQGLLRYAPALAAALAVVALLLLAAAPVGWRAGWWHYRVSLLTLLPYAAYCGIAASAFGALTLVAGRSRLGTRVAIVLGLAVFYGPWTFSQKRQSVPPIHDITTDFADPPAYKAVMPARQAENANTTTYDAKIAEQQRQAYPAVQPATLPVPAADAFKRALAVAQSQGWTIVRSDPSAGEIEASQSSFWFGFTDDVSIRVRPDGSGSRVDMRSLARQGRSDFGVNAARIERFMTALKAG